MSASEESKREGQRSEEEQRLSRWMRDAQAGDAEAYRRLLVEVSSILQRYAQRAVGRLSPRTDPSAAHDLTQEILLAVHSKRHTYDPEQRLLPWVFGIARHKLVDWARKHFSETERLVFDTAFDDLVSPDSPLALTADGDPAAELIELLSHLKPREREVIELTKIQELSVAEVARRTGLSESNVKVLTHRGIASLRKFVRERHD